MPKCKFMMIILRGVIFSLLFFIVSSSFAQKYYFGVKPSVNISNIVSSTIEEPLFFYEEIFSIKSIESKKNISLALVGGININESFSLFSEISMVRKGIVVDLNFIDLNFSYLYDSSGQIITGVHVFGSEGFVSDNFIINLDYLVIPILFSYSAGTKIKFRIFSGVYWSFLMNADGSGNSFPRIDGNVDFDSSYFVQYPMINYFKKHIYGLRLGAGFDMNVTDRLVLSPSFSADIDLENNGFTHQLASTYGYFSSSNISVGFSVGCKYLLKKTN